MIETPCNCPSELDRLRAQLDIAREKARQATARIEQERESRDRAEAALREEIDGWFSYSDSDKIYRALPDGSIVVIDPLECHWQIRTIPADEANEFLRENPGWEPFGVTGSDTEVVEGDIIMVHKMRVFLRRRVCE